MEWQCCIGKYCCTAIQYTIHCLSVLSVGCHNTLQSGDYKLSEIQCTAVESWNVNIKIKTKQLELQRDDMEKPVKISAPIAGSHLKIELQPLVEHTVAETVMYLQQTAEIRREELTKNVEREEVAVHLAQEMMSYDCLIKVH